MTQHIQPEEEVALDIECYSWKMNADVLWSELTLQAEYYNVSGGRWRVEISRATQAGVLMNLAYTTSDELAPPNIGPGTYREALTTRITADFTDPVWTGTAGDHFAARIWRTT